MDIRALKGSDFPGYLALVEELDALHRQALPDRFRAPNGPARSQAYFDTILADGDVRLLGAARAGQLLGFLHAIYRETVPRFEIQVPRRFVVIDNLVVASEHRRGGVARALLVAAHDWARQRGVDTVELTPERLRDRDPHAGTQGLTGASRTDHRNRRRRVAPSGTRETAPQRR